MASEKVKILYSHGGKILPLPPNRLSYVGGQTKLLSLDRRSATLPLLLSRLPSSPPSFSLKYQLPGLDLDSLVSLVDHHDFLHMLYEYDCACSASDSTSKSPRLRLFLFPVTTESPSVSVTPDYLFGLDDVSGAGNSAGSDAFPVDQGGEIFEDLMSGNYRKDRGVNSKLLAEPVSAMVPEPVRVAVPMQTTVLIPKFNKEQKAKQKERIIRRNQTKIGIYRIKTITNDRFFRNNDWGIWEDFQGL